MNLEAIVGKFSGVNAYVVGDAMVDRYSFGRVDRICPEAPVPVFVPERVEERPGGAANVAAQLEALGCMVGKSMGRRHSLKHRLMVGHQLLLRLDQDESAVPTEKDIEMACAHFIAHGYRVLVLSDYAKGWLSYPLCQELIGIARENDIPVVVDPKNGDWAKYYGATVICPNRKEMQSVKTYGDITIVEKQGADGLKVGDVHIPARARHVYDVTGAGDTVTALLAATLGAGGTVLEGAQLASFAAGYVVGEVGTTVCSKEQLLKEIHAAH